jgi:hypothetical protein
MHLNHFTCNTFTTLLCYSTSYTRDQASATWKTIRHVLNYLMYSPIDEPIGFKTCSSPTVSIKLWMRTWQIVCILLADYCTRSAISSVRSTMCPRKKIKTSTLQAK